MHNAREIYDDTLRSAFVRASKKKKKISCEIEPVEFALVIHCILIGLPPRGWLDGARERIPRSENERELTCESTAYGTILVPSYLRITTRFSPPRKIFNPIRRNPRYAC